MHCLFDFLGFVLTFFVCEFVFWINDSQTSEIKWTIRYCNSVQLKKVCIKVINVGSDTFGNPIFQKVLLILDYKHPWMLCLALRPGQKSGEILPFEVVLKLKLPKNHFNEKCALIPQRKKNQKDWDDFW